MATVINILSLLKSFSLHQNSGYVHYVEFADYMRRFAQKHIAEQPEMANYLSQSQEVLQKELHKLFEAKKIFLVSENIEIKGIIVPAYFSEKYVSRINDSLNNPTIPYPILSDLPKNIPINIVNRKNVSDVIVDLLDGTAKPDNTIINGLILPKDLPIVLIPGNLPGGLLVDVALGKIRHMLKKEDT